MSARGEERICVDKEGPEEGFFSSASSMHATAEDAPIRDHGPELKAVESAESRQQSNCNQSRFRLCRERQVANVHLL